VQTRVLIVGGGLTGLALAHSLTETGVDFCLVEARDRLGGRMSSMPLPGAAGRVDLGPSWFWPGQPRIARLLETHRIGFFPQPTAGRLVFETRDGAVRRDLELAPMAGALRIDGCARALVDALAATLDADCVLPGRAVTQLRDGGAHLTARLASTSGELEIEAARVVLALPPRLAAERIRFTPGLPPAALQTLAAVPTWMAGQAKLVAVYDQPFWIECGLSGSAISQVGPLAEVHDASPGNDSVAALFGFVGMPAGLRAAARGSLQEMAIDQLVRLFGPQAATPLQVLVKDWAIDDWTAVAADSAGPPGHPPGGVPEVLQRLWDSRLIVAASEFAPISPGLMEGALEAADVALRHLLEVDPGS
jgi:monoamine oxidase